MATKTATIEKTETKVDTKLATLFKKYEETRTRGDSYFVDVVKYVKDRKVPRGVVIKTLIETRGLKDTTAASEASRILTLAKPENSDKLDALESGEMTLREARASAAKRQNNPAKTNEDRIRAHLIKAAEIAYADEQYTRKPFVDLAADAFDETKARFDREENPDAKDETE